MLKRVIVMMSLMILAGCGFHLRGDAQIPFSTVYIGVNQTSQIDVVLRRSIRGNGPTRIETDATKADIRLELLGENIRTEILTINSLGSAAEYNLYYSLRFRVTDTKGRAYIPITTLPLRRLVIVSSNAQLPENYEISQLVTDMQSDAAQQILRRLEALQPGVYAGPEVTGSDAAPIANPLLPVTPQTPLLNPGLAQ